MADAPSELPPGLTRPDWTYAIALVFLLGTASALLLATAPPKLRRRPMLAFGALLATVLIGAAVLSTPSPAPHCPLRVFRSSAAAKIAAPRERFQVMGAIYPAYRRPAQVARSVASFRRHYPNGPVVVFGDGGDNFTALCERQRCMWRPNPHLDNPTSSTFAANSTGARELLRRNLDAFRELHDAGATHALLLEDDVRVLRPIEQRFTKSISGWNQGVRMMQFPGYAAYLASVGYSKDTANGLSDAGFGGCVFDLEFFTRAVTMEGSVVPLLAFLEEFKERTFVTDFLFSTLTYSSPPGCVRNGTCGTTGSFDELAEYWFDDFLKRVASGRAAVVHKYKDEYDDAVTDTDKVLLGWA